MRPLLLAGVLLVACSDVDGGVLPDAASADVAAEAVGDGGLAAVSLRSLLAARWPDNRAVRVVFHGHSVPAGYHRTPEVRPFDSYPLLTLGRLKDRHPDAQIDVVVTARAGEASVAGAARFARDVLPLRADVVVVDYGLNDRKAPEGAREAWRSMALAARGAGARVVYVTPTGSLTSGVTERAALIRAWAAEDGAVLADVTAEWPADPAPFLAETNHPNRAGHEIAARVLAQAVEEIP